MTTRRSTSLTRLAAGLLFVLVAAVFAPRPAHACWDGWRVEAPHFYVMGGDDAWSADRARHVGEWTPRIEALLAARGQTAEVYFGVVQLESGEARYPDGKMDRLFRVIARELGATPAERRAAMAATGRPVTIQIAASRDRAAAESLARRVSDFGAHGYYEAGGFPADNPTAHVVDDADERGALHRVFVGVFLDRAEATAVADALRTEAGVDGFVRPL